MKGSYDNFNVQRMKQQLNKIQSQVKRSREEFTQDIIIDNKTSQILNFSIRLEQSQNNNQSFDYSSKIIIPNNTRVFHKISNSRQKDTQRIYRDVDSQTISNQKLKYQNYEDEDKPNINSRSIEIKQLKINKSNPIIQRKFQPIGNAMSSQLNDKINESITINNKIKTQNQKPKIQINQENKQNIINQQFKVQIPNHELNKDQQIYKLKENSKNQSLSQSKLINNNDLDHMPQQVNIQNINVSTPHKTDLFKRQGIQIQTLQSSKQPKNHTNQNQLSMPFSLSITQQKNNNKKYQNLQYPSPSPHVQSDQTHHSPLINTPVINHQDDTLNFSFSPRQNSTAKKQTINKKQNEKWQVQRLQTPIKLDFSNQTKTYAQLSKDKQQFSKKTNQERDKRIKQRLITSPSPDKSFNKTGLKNLVSKCQYVEVQTAQKKYSNQYKTINPRKADDLWMQRKNTFLKRLEYDRQVGKRLNKQSRSKSNHFIYFDQQNKSSRLINQREISPKANQISQRLYSSKEKSPCHHIIKFEQEQERDRFKVLLKQNSFVSKNIQRGQAQELFQQLRRSGDSVSLWPMKMVNYTYAKLKKIQNTSSVQW